MTVVKKYCNGQELLLNAHSAFLTGGRTELSSKKISPLQKRHTLH